MKRFDIWRWKLNKRGWAQKKNRIGTSPKTFGTESDAARPEVGWESGVGLSGLLHVQGRFLVRSASYFFLTRNARQLPQP